MGQRAPTQTARSCVRVPLDTLATTVHWITSATATTATAATVARVVLMSERTTQPCIFAAVTTATVVTDVNKLWSVTIYLFFVIGVVLPFLFSLRAHV